MPKNTTQYAHFLQGFKLPKKLRSIQGRWADAYSMRFYVNTVELKDWARR
jgi:hypothetical protein